MKPPRLLDFNKALHNARRFNNNRSCELWIQNQKPIISDVPHQFSLMVRSTKAAKKRGDLKRAFSEFTCDQWYAVMLEQIVTDQWGRSATEYIFTMNPSYKAAIEANLDDYRYQHLLTKIADWHDTSIVKLDVNDVFKSHIGWSTRNVADRHLRHYLYQKVVECGSFPSVVCFLFRYFVRNDHNSSLPPSFDQTIHYALQQLQQHVSQTFGNNLNVPNPQNLDIIITQNINI